MQQSQAHSRRIEAFLASPVFLCLISLTACLTFAGGYLFKGTLFGDAIKNFSLFRDNLDCLSRFGVLPLWMPQYNTGFPSYFYSMLNAPSYLNPTFAIVAVPVWILGRLGIHFSVYQPVYVLYYGFITPFLFLIGFWRFIKHLFKNPYCIAFAMILAAFSPGVATGTTDIGFLEHTAYSLLLFSFILDWLKEPTDRNYSKILFGSALIAVSINIGFLYWNLFAIPFFLFLIRKPLFKKLPLLRFSQIVLLAFVILVCILPNLIAVSQGDDLVRISLGETKQYPFERLLPGSPMEFLSASLPGFGFDWKELRAIMLPISPVQHVAYSYLGILALPLSITGFIYGSRRLRFPILMFLGFYALLACLEGFSPFFGALQILPTPLKSCNHFCDVVYRVGPFILVILGATLGLKTLFEKPKVRSFFFKSFFISCLVTIGIYTLYFKEEVFHNLNFTTYLAVLFFTYVTLKNLFLKTKLRPQIMYLFLVLTLIDVGTFSFFWVRILWEEKVIDHKVKNKTVFIDETMAPNGIGLLSAKETIHLPNMVIMYTQYFRMRKLGFDGFDLPRFHLFGSIHQSPSLEREINRFEVQGLFANNSLPMRIEDFENPLLNRFKASPHSVVGDVKIAKETYNSFTLDVVNMQDGLLFIRDSYSPYWKAKVDGIESKVFRAFYNYKAILLNPGTHRVELEFKPPFIVFSVLCAYLTISFLGIVNLISIARIQPAIKAMKAMKGLVNPVTP